MPSDALIRRLVALLTLGLPWVPVRTMACQRPSTRLVVDAPILRRDYAFFPITVHGHQVTVVTNLENKGPLSLSPRALAKAGVTLGQTDELDSIGIGSYVDRHVPIKIIRKAGWSVQGPQDLPPVVGVAGLRFLLRYDLAFDGQGARIRLYSVAPRANPAARAWLPPGIEASACDSMLPVPIGIQYPPFTGVKLRLDGHPVTGVFEMGNYIPKMNQAAMDTLGLTPDSPNIEPSTRGDRQDLYGHPVRYWAKKLHLTIGADTFWTGPVEIMQQLGVDDSLPPKTPVMLMNLTNLRSVVLFNSVSSGRVCIGKHVEGTGGG